MSSTVTPYNTQQSKKEQVADMFNSISGNYDFLNHFLSMGIDILWRKRAIRLLKKHAPKNILDIATGTGDFAIEALSLNPNKVTGIDISEGMLQQGKEKLIKRNLTSKINLQLADSENLPFKNEEFDAITVGFGVRNFSHLKIGLTEMHRVLSNKGVVAILEFSKPKNFPIKQLYNFYFLNILPLLGKLISKDSRAYTYLPESVKTFPAGEEFASILRGVGFSEVKTIPLSFGIASIYLGVK